jgi:hypothetical protein
MHGPTCVFWANLTPFSRQLGVAGGSWAGVAQVLRDELKDGRTTEQLVINASVNSLPGNAREATNIRVLFSCFGRIPEDTSVDLSTCPGPVGRLSALRVFLLICKSVFYGAFVRARGALKHQKRRCPARAVLVIFSAVRSHASLFFYVICISGVLPEKARLDTAGATKVNYT